MSSTISLIVDGGATKKPDGGDHRHTIVASGGDMTLTYDPVKIPTQMARAIAGQLPK